jgi:mono/diheme cytochrome c family protein
MPMSFMPPALRRRLPALPVFPAIWVCTALVGVARSEGAAVEKSPVYEAEIRPILKAHCTHCHGEEPKPGGGVDLRLRRFMDAKTKDGSPILLPGKPEESELLRVIHDGEMPKKGKKLSADEIKMLERWVRAGANIGVPEPESLPPGPYITAEERKFWAFQPVLPQPAPKFEDAPQLQPVDAFVRRALQARGMDFAPEADRTTLIRRVSLDLTGLPPSPEEVAAFVSDKRAEAYQELVERLLASERYGERWARHWLDVAGYSDTNGYADVDSVRPNAWRYRDYVIRALNADKPWDRFIQEQLAGDELVAAAHGKVGEMVHDPGKFDALAATGFLRLAPDGTGDAVPDLNLARNQNIADTVRIVSTALTGLTVACAQCHDHRYDPITQADYYRLRAVFDPALDWRKWRTPAQRQVSLYTQAERDRAAEIEKQAVEIDAAAKTMERGFLDEIFEKKILELPEQDREPYRLARSLEKAKRTPEQEALLKKYPSALALYALELYDPALNKKVLEKRAEATKLRTTKPVEGMLMVVTEVAGEVPVSQLHHRGDHEQLREEVTPGELAVLGGPELVKPKPELPSTGRRLAYAQWLTSGRHPLMGRVLMNRVWMHHFGNGIVRSAGDFGKLGELPSHPELLDYLADKFVRTGWSLKAMHREMVMSRTYRQVSAHPDSIAKDPENVWLGRFRIRRLDAEAVRDAMLQTAGILQPEMFGAPVSIARSNEGRVVAGVEILNANGDVTKVDNTAPAVNRRSIYLQVRRKTPVTVLDTFDLPIMDPNCEVRAASTVAPQALFLMNDEFVVRVSRALAERLRRERPGDARAQVRRAWELTQGRPPGASEEDRFLATWSEQTEQLREYAVKHPPAKDAPAPDSQLDALGSLCQALLASNRFLHLE